jgi:TonB-linked SusC/RagA family outer membrane protein
MSKNLHVPTLIGYTLRISILQIVLCFFLSSFSHAYESSGQDILNKNVTIDVKNVDFRDVLALIEKQNDVRFLYSSSAINMDQKVNLKANDEKLETVLKQLLDPLSISFVVSENRILLKNKKKEIKAISQSPDQETAERTITGKVTGDEGESLPGVNILIKGTQKGTTTDQDGNYRLTVESEAAVLVFSFIGYIGQEIMVGNQSTINITLLTDTKALNEVLVVGYGTQKKSDITGSVSSLSKDRLEMVPNINIAQAIQGSVPGIMIQQSSAGAAPNEVIMIRGRNSILADNSPLIILDGVPYGGKISDISPNDVASIEILKDASAAAIYGSRGANGVILVTTKNGAVGKAKLSYEGYTSIQQFSELPNIMNGKEFYEFKNQRFPGQISLSEKKIYDEGNWVNWLDIGLRQGRSQQHNLSISGGTQDTKYFIAGTILDVKGIALNDKYQRLTTRINVDTKLAGIITIGTRTQFSMDDKSGSGPSMSGLMWTNPLSTPYDGNGNLTVFPWPEDLTVSNPLQGLLFQDLDKSYQVMTNNYAIIDFPFVKGLNYRINTGLRVRFTDSNTYRGRNTASGLSNRSNTDMGRSIANNTVIENILSYNREFGKHNIFGTALYSYEGNTESANNLFASGFPHDFLSFYSAGQADLISPSFSYYKTDLLSQMLRVNYSYASKYLLTLTGRRDGFSGFGALKKWGTFPSFALGWNLGREEFFPLKNIFDEFKLRGSWGINGNQAVGAYESISRLNSFDMVDRKATAAGYIPSRLGQDELGWESSQTVNMGIDFEFVKNRVSGEVNAFNTRTSDLLLARTISPVHGINSITQNIGKTQNTGIEASLNLRNIDVSNFKWNTSANFTFLKNQIVSLYGILDENGREVNDVVNQWFIGKPARVIYDYVWDGTWQLNEASKAAEWGTQPGFVKLRDVDSDGKLTSEDRQIIGQQDPKLLWGLTNSFVYKQFKLQIFMHGVHGVTKNLFPLMTDLETFSVIRRNTTKKNWWTPENPTNDFVMNHLQAEYMAGIRGYVYQSASFVRIKDISLSYDIPASLISKYGLSKLRVYSTGRNLFTFTKWQGLDPELSNQEAIPLQKEFVLGLSLGF